MLADGLVKVGAGERHDEISPGPFRVGESPWPAMVCRVTAGLKGS